MLLACQPTVLEAGWKLTALSSINRTACRLGTFVEAKTHAALIVLRGIISVAALHSTAKLAAGV